MTSQLPPDEILNLFRKLPSVHDLLQTKRLQAAEQQFGRVRTRETARLVLDQQRNQIQQAGPQVDPEDLEAFAETVVELLDQFNQVQIRKVLNATGILLHTGLGRAPLAPQAIAAMNESAGYCNVEIDLVSGKRTQRSQIVEADLCSLTGAEAAHVVNNNAGATGLLLAAFASGREVIVSQGELIEIGGGFRLPEVFEAFGTKLRAVGTTNRTRVNDYANAISDDTGAIIMVHTSNYQVVGFTEQANLKELVRLGEEHDIPVIHDIGSGSLGSSPIKLLESEPHVRNSIRAGADLVLFSGDKLLGGPQCGVIVGKKTLIQKLERHPISRALRVDKVTLAALQATLAIYRLADSDPHALDSIPFYKMMQVPVEKIQLRAAKIVERLSQSHPDWQVNVIESIASVGGGSLPGSEMPSCAVRIQHSVYDPDTIAQRLRLGHPSIVGRVQDDAVLLDLRCIQPEDDDLFCNAVSQMCSRSS